MARHEVAPTMAKTPSSAPSRSQDASERSVESLYDVHGDTAAALEALSSDSEPSTLSQEYNRIILQFLSSSSTDSSTETVVQQLDNWKERQDSLETPSLALDFVAAYNRSLIQFSVGKPRDAAQPLLDLLKPLVTGKKTVSDNLLEVSANTAFLILECILAISGGRQDGIQQLDPALTTNGIVAWLDSIDFESRPRLKFLLALYKSRLDFAARDPSGRMIDSKIKNVRKELKLRPDLAASHTAADTSSIGSSSEFLSVTEESSIYSSGQHQQVVPGNHQEALLQSLNQSALNLKANWERVKRNTKKTLVLCAEARSSDPVYESTHYNNLAVAYASCGKRHLALHSSARSLRTCETPTFRLDGTATPKSTLSILHNASLLAFQAQKFMSAYECMATCLMSSKEYADRPRCWLHSAECCFGKCKKRYLGYCSCCAYSIYAYAMNDARCFRI